MSAVMPKIPMADDEIKMHKPVCADFVSFRAGIRCAERVYAIPDLLREVETLHRDAMRYRFIRDADRSDCITPELSLYAMETLDEYVDAAMDGERTLKGEQE